MLKSMTTRKTSETQFIVVTIMHADVQIRTTFMMIA